MSAVLSFASTSGRSRSVALLAFSSSRILASRWFGSDPFSSKAAFAALRELRFPFCAFVVGGFVGTAMLFAWRFGVLQSPYPSLHFTPLTCVCTYAFWSISISSLEVWFFCSIGNLVFPFAHQAYWFKSQFELFVHKYPSVDATVAVWAIAKYMLWSHTTPVAIHIRRSHDFVSLTVYPRNVGNNKQLRAEPLESF